MGFRNPITSASAVDTRAVPSSAGVRMYETGDANARWGVVEFDDPAADAPATMTARLNAAGGGSVQGSTMTIKGMASNGVTAPELDMNVEAAPTSGYWRVARMLNTDLWLPEGLPFGKLTGSGASPSVPVSQFTQVPLSTTAKLAGGVTAAASGTGLIAPVDGWYVACGLVEYSGAAGGRRIAGFAINGTTQNESLNTEFATTSEAARVCAPAEPLLLHGGDRVSLIAFQSSSGALTLNMATCWLSLTYLGPL